MWNSLLARVFEGPKYEICVAHYYRGKDKLMEKDRFHRGIFVLTDPNSPEAPRGTVYQVVHGRPIFEYRTEANRDIRQKEKHYFGRIRIGEVRRGQMRLVEDTLKDVEVVRDINSTWNCQDWTRAGVKKLAEAGVIDASIPEWLDEELIKTESAYLAEKGIEQS